MKYIPMVRPFYWLSAFIMVALVSCQHATSDVQEAAETTYQTITACFNGSIAGLQEQVSLDQFGDSVNVDGYRIIESTMQTFLIKGKGIVKNDQYQLHIDYTNPKSSDQVTHSIERWSIDGFILKKQVLLHEKEYNIALQKINCAGNQQSDSTLFDSFGGFYEGYSVVGQNGLYGLIDSTYQLTIPIIYKDLEIVNEQSITFYDEQTGLRGILGVYGDTIIPATYDDIHCFNNGLAACLSNGKWGFINRSGRYIIPPIYLEVNHFRPEPSRHPFNEGLANVKCDDGFWIYIDVAGNPIIDDGFFFAKSFVNGQAEVYYNEAWRSIDKNGICLNNCE